MPKGGARPGAGRKTGVPNRRSGKMAGDILGSRQSPLEYLLNIMADGDQDEKRRDWAAEKAMAYIHARPAPVPRTVTFDIPEINAMEDFPAAIASILRATGLGRISPSEAQGVVSIIEAHRKALEHSGVIERLEEIERQILQKK